MSAGTKTAWGEQRRAAVAAIAAHPVAAAATATLIVSLAVIAFPGIDIAVTRLFALGTHFPARDVPALQALRQVGLDMTAIVPCLLALIVAAKVLLPRTVHAIPMRAVLFLTSSLALGPGLVVNALLKDWWGRPRPDEIVAFGGLHAFYPAWIPGGACSGNCSFPSGEASAAFWLVGLVFVVPAAWRRRTLAATLAWAAVISLNRIAFGRHFVSDVVIGWGLVATILLFCRVWVWRLVSATDEARIERALADLGTRIGTLCGGRPQPRLPAPVIDRPEPHRPERP